MIPADWWLLLSIFWLSLLIDCLKITSRARFTFSRRRAGGKLQVGYGRSGFAPPWPSGWSAPAHDLSYSFSPDGLSNLACASAGADTEESSRVLFYPWDSIQEIRLKRGRLRINGSDFAAATDSAAARTLQRLVEKMRSLPREQRPPFLENQLQLALRPTHLRRRLRVFEAHTSTLAALGTVYYSLCLLLSAYLLLDGPRWVGETFAAAIAAALPTLAAVLGSLHLTCVVLGWRTHRRLLPKRSESRGRLLFNALLLPPHVFRLRGQFAPDFFPAQHPLSWLLATGTSEDLRRYARSTLADLRWPLSPRQAEPPAGALAATAWMRSRWTTLIEATLTRAGITPESLFIAPAADSAASCQYCPRCRDQFSATDARCPRGIKLLSLK